MLRFELGELLPESFEHSGNDVEVEERGIPLDLWSSTAFPYQGLHSCREQVLWQRVSRVVFQQKADCASL